MPSYLVALFRREAAPLSRAPQLPDDIWNGVIELLDPASACRLAQSATRYHDLVDDSPEWRRRCGRSDNIYAATTLASPAAYAGRANPYKDLWQERHRQAREQINDLRRRLSDVANEQAEAAIHHMAGVPALAPGPGNHPGHAARAATRQRLSAEKRRLRQELTTLERTFDAAGLAPEVPSTSKLSWFRRLLGR